MLDRMSDVTRLLNAIDHGEAGAAAQLLPLVYDELRRLAAAQMAREKPGQTLNATALVHEAYLRLVGDQHFENLGHFFAAAARAMRRILVERARRKSRLKHGGGRPHQPLPADLAASESEDDLLGLDAALSELARHYPLHAQLVELRYFAGLTGEEAARQLGISPSTTDRHWVFARAWLRRQLQGQEKSRNADAADARSAHGEA